jgi:hypothetical protein
MKIQYAKMIVLMFTALSAGYILNAQAENVNERFSTQLKNGTVPDWQYNKSEPSKRSVSVNKENKTESLGTQIRKGTAPGMKFLPTPAANTSAPIAQKAPAAKAAPLASEQMSNTVTAPQIKVIPLPTQEGPKEKVPAAVKQ